MQTYGQGREGRKRVGKIRGREGEEISPSRARKRGAREGDDGVEEGERDEDGEGGKKEEEESGERWGLTRRRKEKKGRERISSSPLMRACACKGESGGEKERGEEKRIPLILSFTRARAHA